MGRLVDQHEPAVGDVAVVDAEQCRRQLLAVADVVGVEQLGPLALGEEDLVDDPSVLRPVGGCDAFVEQPERAGIGHHVVVGLAQPRDLVGARDLVDGEEAVGLEELDLLGRDIKRNAHGLDPGVDPGLVMPLVRTIGSTGASG